jgi:hypothetical protein
MATPTHKPWTPQQDQQLRDLHAQGLSQAECGRQLGISNRRVSEHSKVLGLSWDRSKTKAATQARVADNKARRAELEAGLLADAARLRAQLWAPTIAFNFGGKDNTYEEHPLDQPIYADQLKIMQATGVAVTHSLKLADHDGTGGDNAAAVDRWLTFMTGEGT